MIRNVLDTHSIGRFRVEYIEMHLCAKVQSKQGSVLETTSNVSSNIPFTSSFTTN